MDHSTCSWRRIGGEGGEWIVGLPLYRVTDLCSLHPLVNCAVNLVNHVLELVNCALGLLPTIYFETQTMWFHLKMYSCNDLLNCSDDLLNGW